jgi:enamine deaminase RidA (YjgF/YER057c/UK114 family)
MSTDIKSARLSIDVEGLEHKSPAPVASRIGQFVMSGGIYARDPATGQVPSTPAEQVVRMFKNIELVIGQAGGTTDDIIKVDIGVTDMAYRELINVEWKRMFPNPESRPARHVVPQGHLPSWAFVRCEITAILR